MNNRKFILFFASLIFVGVSSFLISLYARGYRLNNKSGITPGGLLVTKSEPDSAQVIINGELTTATNDSINLDPGAYDISIQKEGYLTWKKRLIIEPEIVTEVTAHLFKSVPSLSPITFNESINPITSRDQSKIAYIVPPSTNDEDKSGMWVLDTLNLPLGFSREPRRITDGNLVKSNWTWSPDGRQILLTTSSGKYLLDTDKYTPQNQRINISVKAENVLLEWKKKLEKTLDTQINKLPDKMAFMLKRSAKSIVFSPDEEMILYTTKSDDTLEENLTKELPGSSTQTQNRTIKAHHTYIYDIEEDRNFLIDDSSENLTIENGKFNSSERRIAWYATSRHVVLAEANKIVIMDYDGTNKQVVYSGNYTAPNAFPTLSTNRILILTNLGATNSPANIYSLSLK